MPVIGARSATNRATPSLTGEFTTGTVGTVHRVDPAAVLFPPLPDRSGQHHAAPALPAPTSTAGIVTYDANGNLKTIDWRAFVYRFGVLPANRRGGRVWIAATYAAKSQVGEHPALTPEASRGGVFIKQQYFDGSLFVTLTPAVQLGLSFQQTQQTFGDSPFNGTPSAQNSAQRGGAALSLAPEREPTFFSESPSPAVRRGRGPG